jgi:hypothetical protein
MSAPESLSPGLSEVLSRVRERTAAGMRVCCPAKVVRWDPAKRQIDAQPLIQDVFEDEDPDTVWLEDKPVICNVPVVYPSGGGLSITFPLALGDPVLLVFADESLDKWLSVGGSTPLDPLDERNHSVNDAIAIPGVRPFSSPGGAVAAGCVQIGTDGGAFEGVACGGTDYDAYMAALQTHTHPTPAGASSASTELAALTVPPSSATVKVTP